MSRALLTLLFIVFGVFVFLMSFKNMVVYPLLIPIIILVVLWYIVTFLVTRKMVAKVRKDKLLFLRGQYIDKVKNDVIYGALAVTSSEIVFYKRRKWNGGITPIWSAFNSTIESYELEKVDGKHKGIRISVKGEIHPILIACGSIEKEEKAFRSFLGWDEHKEDEMISSSPTSPSSSDT